MRKLHVFFILIILCLTMCDNQESLNPVKKTKFLLDTIVEISIYDNDISNDRADAIIDEAFSEIASYDSLYNNYNEYSFLSQVNQQAFSAAVRIDTSLHNLLSTAIMVSEQSDGAFDVTVSPILKTWKFGRETPVVPRDNDIQKALGVTGFKHIELSDKHIRFLKKGLEIDLGGIAKGYIIDRAISSLIQNGVTDAMINAGGDIRAICSSLTKGKRNIWIRHPRLREKLFGRFQMDTGSIATSGDYERFFIEDSVRYHHIIDPRTGYPGNKSISVTIMAQNLMLADAYATAVFVMGPDAGLEFIENKENIEGVILYQQDDSLAYKVSTGLMNKFTTN